MRWWVGMAAAGLLLLAPVGRSQTLDAKDVALVRRVDDHYNRLKTLRTRYRERYTGMGMDRTETGTLLLKKPGRMRWEYDVPAGKVFVLDGKYGWSYTPGDTQAQRIQAKQMDDLRSPLRFLLGHTQIEKEMTSLTVASDGSGGYAIKGVPKGMEQRVRELRLDVTPEGVIRSMAVEEVDGAETEFTFSGMEENVALPNADFVFTPPAGVAVVDGLPPV